VCDVDQSKAQRNAKCFGAQRWYTDYRVFLREAPVDAVAVIGDVHLHTQAGVAAARAGKHLFVEKPLAADTQKGSDLLEAVQKSGKIAMSGYMWRYSTPIARMQAIAGSEEFGDPVSMHVRFLTPQPRFPIWGLESTVNTSVVADGGHPIDIMSLMLGRVTSVMARLSPAAHQGVYSIQVLFGFSGGGTGTLLTGTSTSGVDLDFFLASSNGYTIRIENNMNQLVYIRNDEVDYQNVPIIEGWQPAPLTVTDADHTGWTRELRTFAQCICKDVQPGNSVEDGYYVLTVMESILKSIERREEITIPS